MGNAAGLKLEMEMKCDVHCLPYLDGRKDAPSDNHVQKFHPPTIKMQKLNGTRGFYSILTGEEAKMTTEISLDTTMVFSPPFLCPKTHLQSLC